MNILYIKHASFEKIGIIHDWANERDFPIHGIKPYRGDPFPDFNSFDFLIVLGGPQSPRHLEKYPYLKQEIQFIHQAILKGKTVLGFCLGAQLIAESFGVKTQKSPEKEIGIYPITLTEAGKEDPLFHDFPERFEVIHWHNDMPGVPIDCQLLAYSSGCPIQAVRFTPKVYGFQFHMEITHEILSDLISHCPEDLTNSLYTQTKQDLLSADLRLIHHRMKIILDRLANNINNT